MFPDKKSEMSSRELYEMLQMHDIEGVDPLDEALAIFSDDMGNLDMDKLQTSMLKLGYGDYSKKEFEILKEFLDIDSDG